MTTPNLASGTFIYNGLPTGTIDNNQAVLILEKGIPSSPQTIQASLLQLTSYLIGNALIPSPDYISGLNISYTTSGSISVDMGSAYVPSLGKTVMVTGTITQSIPIVATTVSGSWQHVYLYDNAGAPSIEVTGTAPSNAYAGVARTKTGDTSKRYIGSVYCDQSGYLYHWLGETQGNMWKIHWLEVVNAFPFQFANVSGTVTTPTSMTLSWLIPSTNGLVQEAIVQTAHSLVAGGDSIVSIGDDSGVTPNSTYMEALTRFTSNTASVIQLASVPIKITGNSLRYTHQNAAGTNGAFFRLRGITIQR